MSLHCGTALAPSRARIAPAPRRGPLREPQRGGLSPRRPVASASASSGASSSGNSSVPEPADAPGEGRRRRPAVTDAKAHENALEPEKGPQMNSRGIAPDEVAPVVPTREATTEFPPSEMASRLGRSGRGSTQGAVARGGGGGGDEGEDVRAAVGDAGGEGGVNV